MTFHLHRLSPAEFSLYAPQLVDVYLAAMGYNPQVRAHRVSTWRRDVVRPGFTAVIAERRGLIAGVGYGFLGSPDTWWDRHLRLGLEKQGGPTAAQWEMLRSYFELTEIHVHPNFQGMGIGRALLQELLWNIPARYVLLSTPEVKDESNRAFGLYRSVGFFDILRDFTYPGDERPFAVLGAELPLKATPQ
ncbi:GNAT family acetyltraansferase [Corynebacterium phocae]|uniref:GNAT family acetyltraansferase n=1 Tax=Corynebacterium phocae TaxID=161895 RepID=A0A1L7D285_9CORY|nr:N-acetyltransferase [Corynebacterium phocae]APT92218.1 GNAT family acetyltraansferase [Corynebacterium phocae]KAA8725797.1 GNAT family N-acetyltransferase [Corynebacterium phocae]